ncbi:MAG: hypothetical protein Q9222_003887 [Ikaeria aurantiellina]
MTLVSTLKRQRSNSPPALDPQPTRSIGLDSDPNPSTEQPYSAQQSTHSIHPQQPSPQLPLPLDSTTTVQPASSLFRSPSHSTLQAAQFTSTPPLTRANLEQLTRNLTPPSDRKRSLYRSQTKSIASTEASKTTKASDSTDPTRVWTDLRRNFVFYKASHGATIGAQIITKAKEIIEQPRHSTLNEDQQKSVQKVIKRSKFKGETTCIIETLQALLGDAREIRTDQEAEDWVLSAWSKDGMARAWQSQFNAKAIPQLDEKDDCWKDIPRVKTPYPDVLYAYEGEDMAPGFREVVEAFGVFLAKDMNLPFLSLDGKGILHGIEEAEPQRARSGSSMVFHLLRFLQYLASKRAEAEKTLKTSATSSGAEAERALKTPATSSGASNSHASASSALSGFDGEVPLFTFSIAFSPSKVHSFVHFAETPVDQPTSYHMHDIGSYDPKKGADLALLKKHINNILTWGLGERKTALETLGDSVSSLVHQAKKRKA